MSDRYFISNRTEPSVDTMAYVSRRNFGEMVGAWLQAEQSMEYCHQVNQLVATYSDEIYIAMKRTPLSKEPVPNIRIRRTAGQPNPRQISNGGWQGGEPPLCEVEFHRRFSTDLA